jgi:protocatechuate 3,4-dioxygenase, beta subunit
MSGQGRLLRVGLTDNTSAQRTPQNPLHLIPAAARASFVPRFGAMRRPAPGEDDLTRRSVDAPRAAGEVIAVSGHVADARGVPQPGVLLEIWNANSFGRYDHPDDPGRAPLDPLFAGFGRALTDAEGRYRFLTILPAPYLARPDIDRWRPAHVHLSLIGGGSRLVTQMYFPGDRLLAGDPSFQLLGEAGARHLARPVDRKADDVSAAFQFDIVAGSCET